MSLRPPRLLGTATAGTRRRAPAAGPRTQQTYLVIALDRLRHGSAGSIP
ncbi:hypothetical protein [Micromonospora sp. NPDC004551]